MFYFTYREVLLLSGIGFTVGGLLSLIVASWYKQCEDCCCFSNDDNDDDEIFRSDSEHVHSQVSN